MTASVPIAPPDSVEVRKQHLTRLFQFLDIDRDSYFDKQDALELLACFFGERPEELAALHRYLAEEPDPLTAARTPGELRAALLPLLPPGRWDVRCDSWGLVAYPPEQTRSVKAAASA